MSKHFEAIPLGPDERDAELAAICAEPLHVESVDTETGQRLEGVVYRDHLAAAIVERGERA